MYSVLANDPGYRSENTVSSACNGNGLRSNISGACDCNPGWTGDDCTCSTSTESCRQSFDEEICSLHGECICGTCKCDETSENNYSGKYCVLQIQRVGQYKRRAEFFAPFIYNMFLNVSVFDFLGRAEIKNCCN